MTLDALLKILWRGRLLVIVCTAIGAIVAVIVTATMPKIYTGTAVSFVTAVPTVDKSAAYESAQFAVSRAKSYPPLLRSPQVVAAVKKELALKLDDGAVAQMLSAENPPETILLTVQARADSPDLAAQLANSAARALGDEIKRLEAGGRDRPSPINVQVAVSATAPDGAASPRPTVNLALGLLTGFMIGALVTMIRDSRRGGADRNFRREVGGRSAG